MSRVVEHGMAWTYFDDATLEHDRNPAGDVANDPEIMADEEIGDAIATLQSDEQVDDLRLDRDVERRDWLWWLPSGIQLTFAATALHHVVRS